MAFPSNSAGKRGCLAGTFCAGGPPVVLVIIVFLLIWWEGAASGQEWRELLARDESEKAAVILHSLYLEPVFPSERPMPDPEIAEALAQLYAKGRGVEEDRVIACSFARTATASAVARYETTEHPIASRIGRLQAEICGALSQDEREQVETLACAQFGPAPQIFSLHADHVVEFTRRGIRIRYREKETVEPIPLMGCPQRVAMVRHTRVNVTGDDPELSARDLIEVFAWIPGDAGSGRQVLVWHLGEIVGPSLEWHTGERLGDQPGAPWMPSSAVVPAGIGPVTFSTQPTGELTWRFEDSDLNGVLDAPLEVASFDLAPPLPQTGTAHVYVTVKGRSGVPMTGATVKLTGVVTSTATVGEAGTVAFDSLPDGRYDVVAAAEGFVSTVPHVIDLAGAQTADIELTLKPHGPLAAMTIACGGPSVRSVRALGTGADLVLHVRVTGTRAIESRGEGELADISTLTEVRVIQSFKHAPFEPAVGTKLTLEQTGGRIDRGDYIDVHSFNDLEPLNVGDEYVVFLTHGPEGRPWIHGSEEGVFRLRNERVEPVGGGGAARAWDGRPAAHFLAELEKKFR